MDKIFKMGDKYYTPITEENIEQLKHWLMKEFGFEEIPIEMLNAAINQVAKSNPINSLDLKMSREDRVEIFKIRKRKISSG